MDHIDCFRVLSKAFMDVMEVSKSYVGDQEVTEALIKTTDNINDLMVLVQSRYEGEASDSM